MAEQFVKALVSLLETFGKIKKTPKGKFALGNLQDLFVVINAIGFIIASDEDILKELLGASFEEKAYLYGVFKEEFDIENDKLEELIESIFAGTVELTSGILKFVKD